MFLPVFLLVIGALPFWEDLRRMPAAQAALRGVNAAVVGLLLAALYNPVWTAGITSASDFALASSCVPAAVHVAHSALAGRAPERGSVARR